MNKSEELDDKMEWFDEALFDNISGLNLTAKTIIQRKKELYPLFKFYSLREPMSWFEWMGGWNGDILVEYLKKDEL